MLLFEEISLWLLLQIHGGLFWGSELRSSFNIFFTMNILRVTLKIPHFCVGSSVGGKSLLSCPLSIPS